MRMDALGAGVSEQFTLRPSQSQQAETASGFHLIDTLNAVGAGSAAFHTRVEFRHEQPSD